MIHKYSPLISRNQRNTCAPCYINLVRGKFSMPNIYDKSFKIPLLLNPTLEIDTLTDQPFNWIENNYVPYTVAVTGMPPCTYSEGNLIKVIGGQTMYVSIYDRHAPTAPIYSSYIELEQTFTYNNSGTVSLLLDLDGYFQNTTGNIYVSIKDSLGAIMYEGGLGVNNICFETNDDIFTINIRIELDEFTELLTNPPCNVVPTSLIKSFVFNSINLYYYARLYELQGLEDFSTSNEQSIKYNAVNDGSSFCIGANDNYMTLTYTATMKNTTDYVFYILFNNTYGASNIILDIFDENNILYSTDNYPIGTGTSQLLSGIYGIGTNGTYTLRFTIGTGDERICITGLCFGDNYDLSDLGADPCNGVAEIDIKINCDGIIYTYDITNVDAGNFTINGIRYPYRNIEYNCKEPYIQLYYYNSCPINTDDGDFIFFRDENENPIYYSIVLQGVVFGNTPKALDGYSNEYRFVNKRGFAESVFERDIEVDNLPEELVASLQLALMCDNLLIDLGDGIKRKVYSNKNAAIEAESNEAGNLDIKFTLTTYGIINSSCRC